MVPRCLRSRRYPRRIHGVQTRAAAMLSSLHGRASQTMMLPNLRTPFRLLKRLGLLLLFATFSLPLIPARAQNINLEKPLQSINEDVTAFAFAPDGRLIYSVAQFVKTKKF